ncbi:M48 family metalloprotease [Veillonella sp.]|uniref:M48 family metalloprotease n=1 Tax=Veillonella sp. TaxID=1926307 RepID=UPI0025EEC3F2|nr:M48 family metalloprotease [Veillonella sp.]
MGILLVILTAFAYGIVAAVVLHFINSILVVFGIRNLLEQPFILEFLRAFNLPEHSFAVSCVWIGLLFIAFIILYQLPPIQSLHLSFAGITKPKGDLGEYLIACWDDVCQRAGVNPQRYRLYVGQSGEINAFAMGHDRVVVYAGLLAEMDPDELKGVLAHELSHLVHRDTTYGMTSFAIGSAYNLVLRLFGIIIWFIVFVHNIIRFIPFTNILSLFFTLIILALNFIVRIMNSAVNTAFVLLSPFGSRIAEYRADRYAYELGLGAELASALAKLSRYGDTHGFINQLFSDHPPLYKRVAKLQQLASK